MAEGRHIFCFYQCNVDATGFLDFRRLRYHDVIYIQGHLGKSPIVLKCCVLGLPEVLRLVFVGLYKDATLLSVVF